MLTTKHLTVYFFSLLSALGSLMQVSYAIVGVVLNSSVSAYTTTGYAILGSMFPNPEAAFASKEMEELFLSSNLS